VFREGEEAEEEGPCQDLGQRKSTGAPEERSSIFQQRLDLLLNGRDKRFCSSYLFFTLLRRKSEKLVIDFGEICVNEEVNSCPLQGPAGLSGGLEEVGREGVCEELGDDGGLGDYLPIVGEGGDKAARVDGEVFWCAGDGEVNVDCLEIETEFFYGDLGAMSPGAVVCRVEDDLGLSFD